MEIVQINQAAGIAPVRDRPAAILSRMQGGQAQVPASIMSAKLVLRGEETYTLNGHSVRVRAGEMLLVRPEMPVEVRFGDDAEAAGFCLYLEQGEAGPFSTPYVKTRASDGYLGRAHEAWQRLQSGLNANGVVTDLGREVNEVANVMMGRYLRLGMEREMARSNLLSRLEAARVYIEDQEDDDLDLAALSRHAGVSRFHLTRTYRDVYGDPPKRYWSRHRLLRALETARCSAQPIDEVANRLGYSDRFSFSRAFRRHVGQTPGEYLRRAANH